MVRRHAAMRDIPVSHRTEPFEGSRPGRDEITVFPTPNAAPGNPRTSGTSFLRDIRTYWWQAKKWARHGRPPP